MKKSSWIVIVFCLIGLQACSGTRVTRSDANEATDLSGKWNETDSKLVSEHMINTLLEDSWHRLFFHRHHRKPVIGIGSVLNKTTEHISTKTFIKDIELTLLESNEIEIVATGAVKREIRQEKEDHQRYNLHPSGTRIYREKEIDFILRGSIHSLEDQVADTRTVFYQVDLELVAVATNQKVWIAQKRIKKMVEKPLVKW